MTPASAAKIQTNLRHGGLRNSWYLSTLPPIPRLPRYKSEVFSGCTKYQYISPSSTTVTVPQQINHQMRSAAVALFTKLLRLIRTFETECLSCEVFFSSPCHRVTLTKIQCFGSKPTYDRFVNSSWWLNHPFEKYTRQILGSFPQGSG